jgi:hypothetical protein
MHTRAQSLRAPLHIASAACEPCCTFLTLQADAVNGLQVDVGCLLE